MIVGLFSGTTTAAMNWLASLWFWKIVRSDTRQANFWATDH
jgi:hypothetical protein